MIEMFSYPFMVRALTGGILVGILTGFYGVFVVQRGLSFMGSGLAHATFGGIAAALLVGVEPVYISIPFTIFVSLGITFVRNRTGISHDTSVGIFFSVSMALGIILLSFRSGYAADAMNYLFGSILSVSNSDNWLAVIPAVQTLFLYKFWGRWAYATFDRDLARAGGLSVGRDDYLLSAMIAVVVVLSIKITGIILIAALLVLPPASARLVSSRFVSMTILSVLFSIASTVIGIIVSYYMDFPSGASVILTGALLFFILMPFRIK